MIGVRCFRLRKKTLGRRTFLFIAGRRIVKDRRCPQEEISEGLSVRAACVDGVPRTGLVGSDFILPVLLVQVAVGVMEAKAFIAS